MICMNQEFDIVKLGQPDLHISLCSVGHIDIGNSVSQEIYDLRVHIPTFYTLPMIFDIVWS